MFELSARAQDYVERTKQFIQNEIEPIETDFWHEVHEVAKVVTGPNGSGPHN